MLFFLLRGLGPALWSGFLDRSAGDMGGGGGGGFLVAGDQEVEVEVVAGHFTR